VFDSVDTSLWSLLNSSALYFVILQGCLLGKDIWRETACRTIMVGLLWKLDIMTLNTLLRLMSSSGLSKQLSSVPWMDIFKYFEVISVADIHCKSSSDESLNEFSSCRIVSVPKSKKNDTWIDVKLHGYTCTEWHHSFSEWVGLILRLVY